MKGRQPIVNVIAAANNTKNATVPMRRIFPTLFMSQPHYLNLNSLRAGTERCDPIGLTSYTIRGFVKN
jgi:hypothetical protein